MPQGSESILVKAMVISGDQLQDLIETFEDSAQYVCDQHMLSGELVWACAGALSEAKLCEIRGELG
tara:strand:+ start:399 stop:596 length:198 start_codon:yes stop_codon:yes gene_type:complete